MIFCSLAYFGSMSDLNFISNSDSQFKARCSTSACSLSLNPIVKSELLGLQSKRNNSIPSLYSNFTHESSNRIKTSHSQPNLFFPLNSKSLTMASLTSCHDIYHCQQHSNNLQMDLNFNSCQCSSADVISLNINNNLSQTNLLQKNSKSNIDFYCFAECGYEFPNSLSKSHSSASTESTNNFTEIGDPKNQKFISNIESSVFENLNDNCVNVTEMLFNESNQTVKDMVHYYSLLFSSHKCIDDLL